MARLKAALFVFPSAFVSLPALAQAPADRPGYWHPGWDRGWGHMIFGSLMMILFWGGIVLLIILAVRWIGGGPSQWTRASGRAQDSDRHPSGALRQR